VFRAGGAPRRLFRRVFSAASRASGEPKSKLSKRVPQLERDLGVRLIERSRVVPDCDFEPRYRAVCWFLDRDADVYASIFPSYQRCSTSFLKVTFFTRQP
jgi:hypothetical protein